MIAVGIGGALVLALVAFGLLRVFDQPDTYSVSADFAEAPGIYAGNAVKILGIRVGTVDSVKPSASGVRLTLHIDRADKVPAAVSAYLMAPNAVNDRFIELGPAYTGSGPTLPAGATIAREHTVLPQSVDQIIDNLNTLAKTLGPQGANDNGSLSDLLTALSRVFGGSGSQVNGTIKNLGTAVGAVTGSTDDITRALNNLGALATAAAGVSTTYQHLAGNLADVSSALAQDAPAIGGVLANLQRVLSELNTFVTNNHDALGATVTSLSQIAHKVGDQQQALSALLHDLPLTVDNVNNTVTDTPGGPAVTGRLDPVHGAPVSQQVCGDGLLRLMLVALETDPAKRQVTDVACGLQMWLNDLPASPGSPTAPSFTVQALQAVAGNR